MDRLYSIDIFRSNLDPFQQHTDADIWSALEKTQMKDKVSLMSDTLDASVGFGGDNLSVGERQLLCLSRALLHNAKVRKIFIENHRI